MASDDEVESRLKKIAEEVEAKLSKTKTGKKPEKKDSQDVACPIDPQDRLGCDSCQ